MASICSNVLTFCNNLLVPIDNSKLTHLTPNYKVTTFRSITNSPAWDASPFQGYPWQASVSIPYGSLEAIYTRGWRETMQSKVSCLHKHNNAETCQGRSPFSQNSQFEIPEIFSVKRKGLFHASEKLAISLANRDGARSWRKCKQLHEQ